MAFHCAHSERYHWQRLESSLCTTATCNSKPEYRNTLALMLIAATFAFILILILIRRKVGFRLNMQIWSKHVSMLCKESTR